MDPGQVSFNDRETLEMLHQEVIKSLRHCIEVRFSVIYTFRSIANQYRRNGLVEETHRAETEAYNAIETIRRLVANTTLLSPAEKVLVQRRCDHLEQLLAGD